MKPSSRPVIGVTVHADTEGPLEGLLMVKRRYTSAVELAGGLPLMIPVVATPSLATHYLALIDGLVITGGDFDIDPALYGEKMIPQCGQIVADRTALEMALYKKARRLHMPVLGVCGGMQLINVAHGGTLYQDLPVQFKGSIRHEQKPVPATKASHTVTVAGKSFLSTICKRPVIKVNSTHHQAVKKIGRGLMASGVAPDGVVEAVEYKKRDGQPFMLGVQWHPELLTGEEVDPFYRRLVLAARAYAKSGDQSKRGAQ